MGQLGFCAQGAPVSFALPAAGMFEAVCPTFSGLDSPDLWIRNLKPSFSAVASDRPADSWRCVFCPQSSRFWAGGSSDEEDEDATLSDETTSDEDSSSDDSDSDSSSDSDSDSDAPKKGASRFLAGSSDSDSDDDRKVRARLLFCRKENPSMGPDGHVPLLGVLYTQQLLCFARVVRRIVSSS